MQDAVRKGRLGQQKITHCPRGHLYSGSNLYVDPKIGYRECRICRGLKWKRWSAKGKRRRVRQN
jgi:hypothetical protein